MLIVDRTHCMGCRLCEKNCPTKAIRVVGGKAKINNDLCNNCYRCVYLCPNSAIKEKIELKDKDTVANEEELEELAEMFHLLLTSSVIRYIITM